MDNVEKANMKNIDRLKYTSIIESMIQVTKENQKENMQILVIKCLKEIVVMKSLKDIENDIDNISMKKMKGNQEDHARIVEVRKETLS
jgi:hypothetical protein